MASKNRKARKAAARAKRLAKLAALSALGVKMEEKGTGKVTEVSTAATGARYTYTRVCEHEITPIFKLGKAEIYAGSSYEIKWANIPWKLLVSCAGKFYAPEPLIEVNEGARKLLKPELHSLGETPYISFAWPDGGLPPLQLKHWLALVDSIREIDGPVGIFCLGGHGRTGTALSILASLGGVVPRGQDPIKWLRQEYCSNAVETQPQVNYVARMTHRRVYAIGSDSYRHYSGDASGVSYDDEGLVRGGYTATKDGVKYVSTPSPGASPTSSGDQGKLPLVAPQKPIGTAILNAAGDIIGYDTTSGPGAIDKLLDSHVVTGDEAIRLETALAQLEQRAADDADRKEDAIAGISANEPCPKCGVTPDVPCPRHPNEPCPQLAVPEEGEDEDTDFDRDAARRLADALREGLSKMPNEANAPWYRWGK